MFTYRSFKVCWRLAVRVPIPDGRMEVTQMSRLLNRFMCWLRADCPEGVPPTDHVPLIALLTRELSPAEGMLLAAGEVAE